MSTTDSDHSSSRASNSGGSNCSSPRASNSAASDCSFACGRSESSSSTDSESEYTTSSRSASMGNSSQGHTSSESSKRRLEPSSASEHSDFNHSGSLATFESDGSTDSEATDELVPAPPQNSLLFELCCSPKSRPGLSFLGDSVCVALNFLATFLLNAFQSCS